MKEQPPQPRRLLFICTGNVCRSFMAERIARKLAADLGIALEARSCGIGAESYFKSPPEVANALKPLGVSTDEHRPQLVGRPLLAWCDQALAMTRRHREALLDAFPEFTPKVHLLRRYAGLDDADVADPIGQPQKVYDACRDELIRALEALLAPPV